MLRAHLTANADDLHLSFTNDGTETEYVDKRTGCLMSVIPSDAFQFSEPRVFVGPSFCALRQDAGMHVGLEPAGRLEVTVRLSELVRRTGRRVRVRYRGTHRNLQTGAIVEVVSNTLEVAL